eukprot:TRINITY_DN28078_c0_g1_i1.p1 TRINITY_DN28078_c0_g1~~TRINITY_DN28078_c0_g1_i1.p1  ORF type:complete len:146 (-),score=21.39 TRINITY_DN28078_c0_g1_i1:106-483(-)
MDVDIAFMNTAYESGVIDRGSNVKFFHNNPKAQQAVKMLKFAFYDVNSLPGFLCERLAIFVTCTKGSTTPRSLFHAMVSDVQVYGGCTTQIVAEALKEHEGDVNYKQSLTAKVTGMRNVIAKSGI